MSTEGAYQKLADRSESVEPAAIPSFLDDFLNRFNQVQDPKIKELEASPQRNSDEAKLLLLLHDHQAKQNQQPILPDPPQKKIRRRSDRCRIS